MMSRLAFTLCGIAGRILPIRYKLWADAMIAELTHVQNERMAVMYAGGCLWTAMRERARDFDTRFAVGLWSIAIVTSVFAIVQLECASRGLLALMGEPDGMRETLLRSGASPALMMSYDQARPVVVGCFFILGSSHLAAAWYLSRAQISRFFVVWSVALFIATLAILIQLSVIWSLNGLPSEFDALLAQTCALPALLAWSRGRHHNPRKAS